MRTHTAFRVVSASLVLASILFTAAMGQAASGGGKLKGQILVSDQPIPTLDDEDTVADTLKKWQKSTIERSKGAESWSFRIVSFPEKNPGVDTLSLVFYDVSDGKPKYLTSKEISCDPAAEILASEVEVDGEDGIKAGMKVDITLSRIAGGKQLDLAKAKQLLFK